MKNSNYSKGSNGFLKYTAMAFQMMVSVLVFTFLGIITDKYMGREFPLATIIGVLLGVAASLYLILKKI